MSNIAYTLYL